VDIPIPTGRISFQIGDNDKDEEMYPFITIEREGTVLADASGLHIWDHAGENNHVWHDHEFHGPFEFPIHDLTMANCPAGPPSDKFRATIGQRSTRGTNPGWQTTAKVELLVNGNWFTAKPMNPNANEFAWGDDKPGQNSVPLSCP